MELLLMNQQTNVDIILATCAGAHVGGSGLKIDQYWVRAEQLSPIFSNVVYSNQSW